MMQESTIAFIGAGNMAEALIAGLIQNHFPVKKILASDLCAEKLTSLQERETKRWGVQIWWLSNASDSLIITK